MTHDADMDTQLQYHMSQMLTLINKIDENDKIVIIYQMEMLTCVFGV